MRRVELRLKVAKVDEDSILPRKEHHGDAGFDCFAQVDTVIMPGERAKIPLGFCLEIERDFVGLVMEKSGLAVDYGLISIAGVIDSCYRGEVHAVLYNSGFKWKAFKRGEKVAQLLIMPCYTDKGFELVEVDRLSDTKRGGGGFGSTGNS